MFFKMFRKKHMLQKTFIIFVFSSISIQGANVEVSSDDVLVLPGQNATFMCKVAVPLQYCRVEIPGKASLNLNAKLSNDDVRYTGAGLEAGQCGFVINRVDEKNNGLVKCTLGIATESQESVGVINLIVAKPPQPPELEISRGQNVHGLQRINDVLQATCVVRDGRPAANISWYLGDVQLPDNYLSMPIMIDLAKGNLQSKVQNFTKHLQASDNGKILKCVALHPAFPNGFLETGRRIDVKFPPLPLSNPLEKFGYITGTPGVLSVRFQANPKPMIEWIFDDQKIGEGYADKSGRITADSAKEIEPGLYEVNLRFAAIEKTDTEREFNLIAHNEMGSQTYTVRISTDPKPEGLEIGVGSIIGIVVGICFLLVIVFLIIFARLTGRWCFSGTSERHLGESSDTESTDVRPKDRKLFPPIKLTSIFKKDTEKLEQKHVSDEEHGNTEETKETINTNLAEQVPTEHKENVLYAELDLVNSENKPIVKNDSDKTEYAEIVYNPKTVNKNSTEQ